MLQWVKKEWTRGDNLHAANASEAEERTKHGQERDWLSGQRLWTAPQLAHDFLPIFATGDICYLILLILTSTIIKPVLLTSTPCSFHSWPGLRSLRHLGRFRTPTDLTSSGMVLARWTGVRAAILAIFISHHSPFVFYLLFSSLKSCLTANDLIDPCI